MYFLMQISQADHAKCVKHNIAYLSTVRHNVRETDYCGEYDMDYLKRIADEQLRLKMEAFGAALIIGPKGCGKTTTAKQQAKSYIEFQDEDERENYLLIANTHPSDLLKGAKPRLFDEWQDAPKIWGAVRKALDDSGEVGQYILTGSSSASVDTPHTGTLRNH